MEFKTIKDKLKSSPNNTFEFFGKGIRLEKNYTEVYSEVLKTVNFLKNLDIKRNSRIGILSNNSYEWVLIDLACLLGGYVLVSLHVKDFDSQVTDLHNRFNLKLLCLEKKYAENIQPASDDKNLYFSLDRLIEEIDKQQVDEALLQPFEKEDVFTIFFTSGTTGIPKGLEVKIKCAEDFVEKLNEIFTFSPDDKIINFLPLSVFTLRLYIYGAILLGFNIVLTSPENLVSAMRLYNPTILQGIPHLYENVYKSTIKIIRSSYKKFVLYRLYLFIKKFLPPGVNKKIQGKVFKDIKKFWGGRMRIMFTGSAPTSPEVLKFFHNVGLELYEAYGTNETGLISINSPGMNKIGSVGKPIRGKDVSLDENKQVLVKSNYCWASKYLDVSEEMNANVFKDDGVIATGDIGYFDEDGFLFLKGRIKEIITLSNGQKVNPVIIEKQLESSPFIKQSMLFGDSRSYLVAVIVKDEDELAYCHIPAEVKSVNENLPDYSRLKDFIVAREPFTLSNQLLSNNMKLNRSKIYETYKQEIDRLYE